MTVHTPDDIENIFEDDEENDGSNNVSSDAQETGSNNLAQIFMFCRFFRTFKSLSF